MSAKDSVVDEACQVKGTERLSLACIAWMKEVESADQPLLVLLGLWHHAQVVPSLRWPAWKDSVVNAPSSRWQALQRLSSTMARRPVVAVAAFCVSGAMTMSPPIMFGMPAVRPEVAVAAARANLPLRFGSASELSIRLVCVSGMLVRRP